MRILLWSPNGAGLHYGGPGTSAFRLYSHGRSLTAAPGFELTLAHGSLRQEAFSLFHRQVLVSRLDRSALSHLRFVRRARSWIREHATQFDIFHGLQGFELTVAPAREAKRRGLPTVVKLVAHRSDLASKAGWKAVLRLPEKRRRIVAELDAVIAISRAIADELLEYGIPEEKIVRIPNGVDTTLFRPATSAERPALRESLGWKELPTLLFVGGLVGRKNPHVLLDVVHHLGRRGHEIQLVLAGPESEPTYAMDLRRRVEELGISERVVFAGHRTEIASYYRAADVFALPSDNEGMPNALLEAMASGLACVATPVSGSEDLIADGVDGRLVSARCDTMIDPVAEYFDSPKLRTLHGNAARAKIERDFGADVVFAKHLELFTRLRRR